MKICLYRSAKDSDARCYDVSWEQLSGLLSEFEERTDKDGKAWSPVEILNGASRASKNVTSITCAVFDLDKVTQAQIKEMSEALKGIEYVAHSTFSHNPVSNCLRVIIPLQVPYEKENLSTAQYQAAWQSVRERLVRTYKIPADPSCKDLSRIYFLPTMQPGAERISESNKGTRLALSTLSGMDSGGVRAPTDNQETNGEAGQSTVRQQGNGNNSRVDGNVSEKAVDLKASYDSLKRNPLLKDVLAGNSFAKTGERDAALVKIAGAVAWTLPKLPVEAFIELIAKSLISVSLEAEPGTKEATPEYWIDLAKAKFERSLGQYHEHKAEELIRLGELEKLFGVGANPKDAPDTDEWRGLLQYKEDKDGNLTLRNSIGNGFLLLKYSPEWRGAFRLNTVTHTIEIARGPISPNVDPDNLATLVTDWLSIHAKPDERLSLDPRDVYSRISTIAENYAYDPIQDYLNSLTWDGTSRLAEAPFKYFNALKYNEAGAGIVSHVGTVFKRWMVGAVARAFDPGCKMDTVLILESVQGQRKSTALKVLGGEWFTDAAFTIGDKDGSMIIGRAWICELAEMDNVKTTEPASHRAFFSRRTDTFRAPYGRVVRDWARRCVFVGSINPDGGGYLKDLTGNRRYWPIAVGIADTRSLYRDRDQLWAEAVSLYKASTICTTCAADEDLRCSEHRWWLTREEEVVAEQQADLRVEADDTQSLITAWWRKTPINMRPINLTTSDLAVKLGYPIQSVNRAIQIRLGHALKKLKFKTQRPDGGQRIYIPSGAFLNMPYDPANVSRQIEQARA